MKGVILEYKNWQQIKEINYYTVPVPSLISFCMSKSLSSIIRWCCLFGCLFGLFGVQLQSGYYKGAHVIQGYLAKKKTAHTNPCILHVAFKFISFVVF